MSLGPGIVLGLRYEILSLLGAGGMGEVYRAKDLRLGREVAIKVLPAHLSQDPQALSRFEREAKALAALSHTNILTIHDFGTHEGISFAVMELLKGETLRSRLRNSKLPWKKAIEMGIPIVEALAAAHSAGVIHRDLKPENIFITSDQGVRILDFGLARWQERVPGQLETSAPTISRTSPGMVMGTLAYMSPEQIRGESVDARSDVFSFGCVLYEMVSQTPAFVRKSPAEIISAVLNENPPKLAEYGHEIPEQLQHVITHCLEKNLANRFQSASDIAFDLRTIISQADELKPYHRRKKFQFLPYLSSAIILMLILASFYLYRNVPGGESLSSVAVLPFTNLNGSKDTEYLSDGITESTINNLSQLSNLRVMARDTVFRYKDKNADSKQVGRDLKVDAVVMGRVMLQGDTLVIRASLVKVVDGAQLWGDQYNRKLADILILQEEISKKITENLRVKLTGEEKQLIAKHSTDNPEAYRLYLKGRYHVNKETEEEIEKGRPYFQQAIDTDPGFALGYAGLGNYFTKLASEGYRSPKEMWPKAAAAFRKASELDEKMPVAGVGQVKFYYEWKWTEAEQDFLRAIARNPGWSGTHYVYSQFLLAMGRHKEAIKEIRICGELDPLGLGSNAVAAQYLTIAGRYDEAIKELQDAIDMDPNYDAAHFALANVYERKGMYDDAISEWKKGYLSHGDKAWADLFEDVQGKSEYFQAINTIAQISVDSLVEMSKEKYVSPIFIAKYYSLLNKKEEAFSWLEKAYEDRSMELVFLKVDQNWNNLRSDPRFTNLVKRIGLP